MGGLSVCLKREDGKYLSALIKIIHKHLVHSFDHQQVSFYILTQKKQNQFTIQCSNNNELDQTTTMIEAVSRAVAEFIVQYKEKSICEDIYRQEYSQSKLTEQRKVLDLVRHLRLESEEDVEAKRMSWIEEQVYLYLERDNSLVLDGFIRFRLKHYGEDLRKLIEYAREEYFIDQELKGHIDLLKSSIAKHETKLSQLHIVHEDDRNLYLFDKEWKQLYSFLIDGISLSHVDGKTSYEDLIVRVILSLNPMCLTIHTRYETYHLVYMIRSIFAAKVRICVACPDCLEKITPVIFERLSEE